MGSFTARLGLLLALVACGGSNHLPPPVPAGTLNAKPLADPPTREVSSRAVWQASGYFRLGDELIDLPVLMLAAADGTVCIVKGPEWSVAERGELHTCATGWRYRR